MKNLVSKRNRAINEYARLSAELDEFCLDNNLPLESADELEARLFGDEFGDEYAVHRAWLRDFCDRWDAVDDDLGLDEVA